MSIYIDGMEVESVRFPNGEVGLKLNFEDIVFSDWLKCLFVTVDIQNSDDLVEFLLFQDMLKEFKDSRAGNDLDDKASYILTFPFFPYSRADRRFENMPFSLKWFCKNINLYLWDNIYTTDAHNPEAIYALLGSQFTNLEYASLACLSIVKPEDERRFVVVSPDEGATKRARQFYDCLKTRVDNANMVEFVKNRDEDTGKITSIAPKHPEVLVGDVFIVVDDICDAGGTFLGVAEWLPKEAQKILYVTHGFFSKGTKLLTDVYDEVYTTSTVYNQDNERVFVI